MTIDTDVILERALNLKRAGQPFVLATVVHSRVPASAKPGAKAIIEPDGTMHGWIGGGCAQPAVIKVAKRTLKEGKPYLVRISPSGDEVTIEGVVGYDMQCHSGGSLDIFVEPVLPRPRLLILGTSPIAQALAQLAARAGYVVRAAAPEIDRDGFADAEQVLDHFDVGAPGSDFVVVATQGRRDEEALEAALRTSAPYITMVASRRKAAKLKEYLRERGNDPARIDAIIAPAGLDIGAVTPGEIAVSVLGALIQARRDMAKTSDAKSEGLADEVGATDPVCGMGVEPQTAEHFSVYEGTTYYFCGAGCRHEFQKAPARYLAHAVG